MAILVLFVDVRIIDVRIIKNVAITF